MQGTKNWRKTGLKLKYEQAFIDYRKKALLSLQVLLVKAEEYCARHPQSVEALQKKEVLELVIAEKQDEQLVTDAQDAFL